MGNWKGDKMKKLAAFSVFLFLLGFGAVAQANVFFSMSVGDADGFGFGAPNQGIAVWPGAGSSGTGYDGRSAAEIAATHGAQITDCYSAIYPAFGPNSSETASIIFPLSGFVLKEGTLTVAMGDFQATKYGAIKVDFNGIAQSWTYEDGFQVTKIRAFVLTPAEIAAANLAGNFIINLDHTGSDDFVAFDYFALCGTNTPVPIPGAVYLLGSGLLGMLGLRRKFVA
jgi:hypothetical protein